MSAMPVARFIADESADSGTNRDAETTGEGSQSQTGETADECSAASAGIPENFLRFSNSAFSELADFTAEPRAYRSTAADAEQSERSAYDSSCYSAYYFT